MAFIGTPLDTRNTFQSLVGKRFNGDGSTTAFTLDVAPSSTLDIEVFVGNVRQDPNSAYTLSGTTLTFTGAPPSGTNNIYVVHQAKSVGTIDPPATETIAKTFSGNVTMSGTNTLSGATTVSGALTASGGATISGTTPTLTIGDAGAEDTKIVFDGNAQDYHIGLDDSADDLVIGLGSTLGTTSHIVIDEAGHVTKPLNPAFRVYQSSDTDYANNHTMYNSNITEVYDVNADMGTNGSFTAPVTGKYLFTMSIYDVNATENTNYDMCFITSNRNYRWGEYEAFKNGYTGNTNFKTEGAIIADMDANDTAYVKCCANVTITNGGNQEHSYFSGILIG